MSSQPNVLFINTDQLRPDFLGCHGYPLKVSPNIDRLAESGIVFDNCLTQSPVCVPARYSLLSGQYPETTGVFGNGHYPHPQLKSLIDSFNEAGYHTSAMGKLHHNPRHSSFGFQQVTLHDGFFPDRIDHSVYCRYLDDNGLDWRLKTYPPDIDADPLKKNLKDICHWGESAMPAEHEESAWLGKAAIRRIQQWRDESPLFLYVSFVDPHSPYFCLPDRVGLVDPDDIPLPPHMMEEDLERKPAALRNKSSRYKRLLDERTSRQIRACYLGVVNHLDYWIGKVVEAAREKFGKNLIISLTSDHGDFLGEHGLCEKNFHYESAVKVPWILETPDVETPGSRVNSQVEQIDQIPTILRACGVPFQRDAVAGVGYSAAELSDPRFAGKPHAFAQIKFSGDWGMVENNYSVMVRSNESKMIISYDAERSTLFEEFYDLNSDPFECFNRIDDGACRERVAELRDALWQWQLKVKQYQY